MLTRLSTTLSGPLVRRAFFLLAPLALLPLIVAGVATVWQSAEREPEQAMARASIESRALAGAISARLSAAESGAWSFARDFAVFERNFWREQVAQSAPFLRATVSSDSSRDLTDRPLVPGQSQPKFDDTALAAFGSGDSGTQLYLVRALRDLRGLWAYFELDQEWLWQDLRNANNPVAVIDSNGQWLYGLDSIPAQSRSVLGAAVLAHARSNGIPKPADSRNANPDRLSWQAGGREWRGAHLSIPNIARLNNASSWHVVVVADVERSLPAQLEDLSAFWLPVAIALLTTLLLAAWLARRYQIPLVNLQAAVLRIGQTESTARDPKVPAELAPLAHNVRVASANVAEQVRALQALEEVDRLLLANSALEPAIDAILARVQRVLGARAVGIALIDADSAQYARVVVAADSGVSLPVARVTMDPAMVEYLSTASEGITVARCEEGRHSFLRPLQDIGNEYFWVWPVRAANRLTGLLLVGFRDPPLADPRIAQRGSEFAARLSIALSKSVRDETLYRQAYFDPLTGLPNRVLFNERAGEAIEAAILARHAGALLYVDLDHFKKVNDSVGHSAGDQLLIVIAQRLRAAVKEDDTVARLAGDEFTVVLKMVDEPESAALVAERIIESLQKPVNIAGRDHFVTASIGITMFPNDGDTLELLMRNADGAMYRAKEMGRGRAVFFDRKLALSELDPTQSGLFRALRRSEFTLFYQPQFAVGNGALVGVEALLRWQTPRNGTREPKEFIPAAETSGLIVDIGGWVLEAACAQYAAWREMGVAPPRLSINVSAQQLKYPEFARSVRRVLEKFAVPSQVLEIELTESVLAEDSASAALLQLAALGVRIALDDFGTGFSSLNYLRLHPIHAVKIDRSFLEEVPINAASATLAETIITMAHALDKEVVAEGVETEEQLQFLRDRGCDVAQGFYLARPMPAAQFAELLQSRQRGSQPVARAAS